MVTCKCGSKVEEKLAKKTNNEWYCIPCDIQRVIDNDLKPIEGLDDQGNKITYLDEKSKK
ncbi:hypothetical protein DRO61_04040 [Candidatus Bathyarchaeota archaeon]|nr:MAG: hypothetical protein DRO61_04040 [Candidatus Bathyarchaeota archaeon]